MLKKKEKKHLWLPGGGINWKAGTDMNATVFPETKDSGSREGQSLT